MMIKSPDQLCPEKKDSVYVFLCGPIQGAPDWQSEVPDIEGVTWINPKREGMDGFDWEEQVKWETMGLSISDFVLISIFHPVSIAASLTFCPFAPIAKDN